MSIAHCEEWFILFVVLRVLCTGRIFFIYIFTENGFRERKIPIQIVLVNTSCLFCWFISNRNKDISSNHTKPEVIDIATKMKILPYCVTLKGNDQGKYPSQ